METAAWFSVTYKKFWWQFFNGAFLLSYNGILLKLHWVSTLIPNVFFKTIVTKMNTRINSESSCHAAGQNTAPFIDWNTSLGHFHPSWGARRGTTAHGFAVFLAWTQLLIKVWLNHKPSLCAQNRKQCGSKKCQWRLGYRSLYVAVWGTFLFCFCFFSLWLFTSFPFRVRNTPCASRCDKTRKLPSGFLVASAGSRKLKMAEKNINAL